MIADLPLELSIAKCAINLTLGRNIILFLQITNCIIEKKRKKTANHNLIY